MSLKNKKDELKRALKGTLEQHQLIMLKHQIDPINSVNSLIQNLDSEFEEKTKQHRQDIENLDTIPSIGVCTAQRIVAEMGFDMERFPTSAHLGSWADLVPCNNESAGKKKAHAYVRVISLLKLF